MVGHRDRGHLGFFYVFEQWADFVGPVQQAVLSMNVQMDKTHKSAPASRIREQFAKSPRLVRGYFTPGDRDTYAVRVYSGGEKAVEGARFSTAANAAGADQVCEA
jgi:hypothetical protein